jgi:hypothetical protein
MSSINIITEKECSRRFGCTRVNTRYSVNVESLECLSMDGKVGSLKCEGKFTLHWGDNEVMGKSLGNQRDK